MVEKIVKIVQLIQTCLLTIPLIVSLEKGIKYKKCDLLFNELAIFTTPQIIFFDVLSPDSLIKKWGLAGGLLETIRWWLGKWVGVWFRCGAWIA